MTLTVIGIAEAVRTGRVRARTVVEESLTRIADRNGALNAFIEVDAPAALAAADAIDAQVANGQDPGPLSGVPTGVKDLEDAAGLHTRYGSVLHANDPVKTADSLQVARLRRAGAVILGKTATAEFGLDNMTSSSAFGVTRNPWNLALTPGGSSGGSAAAVSAGIVPLATASDGGGSTRAPAAWTGLVGLKPSNGRIPRDAESLFSVAGALTTTVADTARVLDVVAGQHPKDRFSLPTPATSYETAIEELQVKGLRVGWSDDFGYAVMEAEAVSLARDAADTLIRAAGLRPCAIDLRLESVRPIWRNLMGSRVWSNLVRAGQLPARLDELSEVPRRSILSGSRLGIEELYAAERKLADIKLRFAALFEDIDVLLSPTVACPAFPAAGPAPTVLDGRDASNTGPAPIGFIANTCWNPAISVPAGLTASGLPMGLMITGRHHRDDILLRLARILEVARPWPAHAPGYR